MRYQSPKGYTLLELIVAVGIFSLIMLAVTSAYLSLIKLDRETRAVNDIINNLSFAVDSMGREMRTGSRYDCSPSSDTDTVLDNCTQGTLFQFRDSSGRTVRYFLSNGQIIARINGVDAAITDPRITITNLLFYVRGAASSDTTQPQVLVTIKGGVPVSATRTASTSVQVSATQRLLDL